MVIFDTYGLGPHSTSSVFLLDDLVILLVLTGLEGRQFFDLTTALFLPPSTKDKVRGLQAKQQLSCCSTGGSKTMEEQAQRSGSDARRRKVRKGTHSCWECKSAQSLFSHLTSRSDVHMIAAATDPTRW